MPRWGAEVQLYSFFNLGAKWGWVVNAMTWLLYPLEKETQKSMQTCFISLWLPNRLSNSWPACIGFTLAASEAYPWAGVGQAHFDCQMAITGPTLVAENMDPSLHLLTKEQNLEH
jgi:hypothetical protein